MIRCIQGAEISRVLDERGIATLEVERGAKRNALLRSIGHQNLLGARCEAGSHVVGRNRLAKRGKAHCVVPRIIHQCRVILSRKREQVGRQSGER